MFLLYPSGGLGNQMFMIASTYAMARATAQRWYVNNDVHSLIQGRTFPNYINNIFWQVPLATKERIAIIGAMIDDLHVVSDLTVDLPGEHVLFPLNPFERQHVHVVIDSHLMSYHYFKHYRPDILKLFSLPPEQEAELQALEQEYLGSSLPTVSLHVRRGDYLRFPDVCRVLEADYYHLALEKFAHLEKFKLIVFSDDIPWCEQAFTYPQNCAQVVYIPEQIPDYLAMMLMSRCQHNIIANSTFSWWGAYLNPNPEAKIISPERWFNDPKMKNTYMLANNFEIITDEQIKNKTFG
ncbi:hypothetical protein CJP74_04855 [Psittacicella melopsittaci]|uniref:Glycosyl transferase family 11 n=1 Tax=Psittacicella melopsittaci TaxID=2028576 RepID=A0A3A1Y4W0_9GAMM|nr:alpha-1,2-fucosyltransferase [Psittacicella melopsittaci]RIY32329.1 hypothetical protein CJP74_04855 [Psittacicella melopsittaci]